MLQGKRVKIVNNTPIRWDLQTPFSNCWSMNEFAVGPNVGGPEDEPGDWVEGELGESSDSSTV